MRNQENQSNPTTQATREAIRQAQREWRVWFEENRQNFRGRNCQHYTRSTFTRPCWRRGRERRCCPDYRGQRCPECGRSILNDISRLSDELDEIEIP